MNLYKSLDGWDSEKSLVCRHIEQHKQGLLKDKTVINKIDFGAGSRSLKPKQQSISWQTNNSACPSSLGKVLFNITNLFNEAKILELGTHFGIGTAYLASSESTKTITSIEACKNTFAIAEKFLLSQTYSDKISLINSTFYESLEKLNNNTNKFNLFYIDGDHKGKSLINYFTICKEHLSSEKSIFVIDDINWSKDMFSAWNKLCNEYNSCSINAGRFGILLFDNTLPSVRLMLKFSKPLI